MFYEKIIRPIFFLQDPERVHHRVMRLMEVVGPTFVMQSLVAHIARPDRGRPVELFGLKFPNVIGLAAGFDKNAVAIPAWQALGFGFVEIGTVTAKAQPGNDRPRLFRIPEDGAVINRMGFNNDGAEQIARRLSKLHTGFQRKIPLGINLGKSKVTPLEEAAEDYLFSFTALYEYGDYFVVNVSSPNTPGLRELQDKEHLRRIFSGLQAKNRELGGGKPILVKIAPDLEWEQIDQVLEVVDEQGISGIIATNTTITRHLLQRPDAQIARESGGLSGKPLRARATEVIRYIAEHTGGKLPVIGAGGIFTADDAREKLDAGAALLQVYTGFIYEGPLIAKKILSGL
ncbi:quinone-dependent dihydroorotate dehydrogenase [Kamptonema cortianum]|nr:quinone-dependent dihydroorotate dehydrogenase [Kamptonema cortianum]MDL5053879.1 quinone-dependent dihydroorotate dehydrogenase [Oscillatoria laete-virens NRMC-F 0139]